MPTRKNVFETNSSSTHAITIGEDDSLPFSTIQLNDEGNVVLNGYDFNWQWERWNDPRKKAEYCMIRATIDDNKNGLALLRNVIQQQTGANNVIMNALQESRWSESGMEATGTIDHASYNVLAGVFDDKEKLRRFIFHPNSWLMLGNDNTNPPNPYFYYPNNEFEGKLLFKNTSYPLKDIHDQHTIKNKISSHYHEMISITEYVDIDIEWENNLFHATIWTYSDKHTSKKNIRRKEENVEFQITKQ